MLPLLRSTDEQMSVQSQNSIIATDPFYEYMKTGDIQITNS